MKNLRTAVALTALIAGTLDIAAAMLNFVIATGKNPFRVLQFIASGVFGKDAFTDDLLMPVYGLIFHFCIATIWTTLYFSAYPKIKIAATRWMLSGVLYAVIVWSVMTQAVLPLSNVPQQPFDIGRAALAAAILIVCIG
ncbi:MAG: hypothetical protein HYV29_01965 [Ignavibacteriales bacterium]|nr:hypothetical protein [Ignavibacteriales bacterium]